MLSRHLFVLPFLLFVLVFYQSARAQFTFRLISESEVSNTENLRVSASERDSTQLELPFWDDFSNTSSSPDSAHWFLDVGTVNISGSLGINAPTINVASFDGWNSVVHHTVVLNSKRGRATVW